MEGGVDLLRAGGVGGQFRDQRVKKGWLLEKTAWKKAGELTLKGQIRIRRGRAFPGQGSSEVARRRRWRGLLIKQG